MKNRIEWIDTAKGIGILLVVLGHTMSPVMAGHAAMEWLYKVLYCFHMPLFFLLAGMVGKRLLETDTAQQKILMKNRCRRLLVPYFTWAAIYMPMKAIMSEHVRFQQTAGIWTIFLGNNPAGQLWFLYVLFVLSAVTIFLVNKENLRWWCYAGLTVSFFARLIPDEVGFPGIGLFYSVYQVGFWFLGLSLADRTRDFLGKWRMAAVSAAAWIPYGICLLFGKECWYLMAVSALGGCYLTCFAAVKLQGRMSTLLSYLGRCSMWIYVLHAPLLVVGRILVKPLLGHAPWIYAITLTGSVIVLSLIASEWIIRKVHILRIMLFGEV